MLKKQTLIIFILNLIFLSNINATNKIDSLLHKLEIQQADTSKVTVLNEISQEYLKTDFNKALEYANKALILSKKINNKKSIAQSYTYTAYAQYRLNNFEDAKININKALVIYEILKNNMRISQCYSFISQIHYALQEYPKAVEWVNKSIKIKEDNNLTEELEINYLTLGAIYQKQGKYELAIKNLIKSAEYYDKNGKSNDKASVFNNIAVTYRKLNDYDEAEKYYLKSLELYKKNNEKFGELKIYNNLAVLYEQTGRLDEAVENYKKVLQLSKEMNYKGGIAMAQINTAGIIIEHGGNLEKAYQLLSESEKICKEIKDNYKLAFIYGLKGQYFAKKNNYINAVYFTKKAYNLTVKIKSENDKADMALQLSEYYQKQNDYKNALKYFQIYHSTNDSIFNIEKVTKIEELKTRFKTENQEKELKIKEQKIKILEKEQKIDSIKNYLSLFGKILIFTVIIFIILFYRKKLKRQKDLAEKNKKIAEAEKRMLELDVLSKKTETEQLEKEVEYKSKELQNFAHYIIDKNEFIIKIQKDLKRIKKDISEKNIDNSLQEILIEINNKIQLVRDNEEFLAYVDQINDNFYFKLKNKFPDITEHDKRLASLIKMGLSSKEIASILHITPKSVDTNRYRLRKKLKLSQEYSLYDFLKNL